MPLENIPYIDAKDFGKRLALYFKKDASSTVWFFIQQAYKDVGGMEELDWDDVVQLLDRVIKE
jgi:hypothetical protein